MNLCYRLLAASLALFLFSACGTVSTSSGSSSPIPYATRIAPLVDRPTAGPAATNAPATAEPTANTPAQKELTTPELIDQALASGQITAEERILYLAYAVYEPDSLPARFNSSAGWFGTAVVKDIHRAVDDRTAICSMSPQVRAELQR